MDIFEIRNKVSCYLLIVFFCQNFTVMLTELAGLFTDLMNGADALLTNLPATDAALTPELKCSPLFQCLLVTLFGFFLLQKNAPGSET